MCTRFARMSMIAALQHALDVVLKINLTPQYNIAPSDETDVLIQEDGNYVAKKMLFGMIPSWAKDPKIAFSCLNARSETISEKPAFRNSFKSKRCAIIADGFFEWQRDGKVKKPYFFKLKSNEPFALAGLWDRWKSPHGKTVETFCIITTESNSLLAPIHDRMPIILDKKTLKEWTSDNNDPQKLKSILKPFSSDLMTCHRVSTKMNNSRFKDSSCIVENDD